MAEPNHTNTNVRFEHRDVNVRSMAWVIVTIIVTAFVLHVVLYFLYAGFRTDVSKAGRMPKTLELTGQQTAAQPKLQVDPATDIHQLRAEENKKLSTYGWVDKEQGVVRIPVKEAIRLLADRGFRSANPANPVNGSKTPVQRSFPKQK